MDIRCLEDFVALCELKSFTKTARLRNVSQAALSRRIQSLEEWAGAELISKNKYPLELTPAGTALLAEAENAVDRLSTLRTSLKRKSCVQLETVRIAMTNVVARAHSHRIFEQFGDAQKLCLSLVVGNAKDCLQRFLSGNADILICHVGPALSQQLDSENHLINQMISDRFRPYCSSDYHNSKRAVFPGTLKKPFNFVGYSSHAYFGQLLEYLMQRNEETLHFQTVVQCDMSDVLKEMILAGKGIGWLPESSVDPQQDKKLVPVGGAEWSIDIDVSAIMSKHITSHAVRRLWDAMMTKQVTSKDIRGVVAAREHFILETHA